MTVTGPMKTKQSLPACFVPTRKQSITDNHRPANICELQLCLNASVQMLTPIPYCAKLYKSKVGVLM